MAYAPALVRRRRLVAAKVETTPGTAISLAAADAALNCYNPTIQPDIPFEEREGQGSFSPRTGALGARSGTLEFETDMWGQASTPPGWATILLPAVGMYTTALVYALTSKPPGASAGGGKTLTMGLYEDGVFKTIRGAVGNAVLTFVSGRPVRIKWTFKGIWDAPTDVALLAPTYPTVAPLRFASSGLAIGSWTPQVQEMTLDLGNIITLREDSADVSGYHSAVLGGRRITGHINPEAGLVATKDVYGILLARTESSVAITLGTAGNQVAFAAPKMQFTSIKEADRNGVQVDDIQYQLNRSAADDDELTITFA